MCISLKCEALMVHHECLCTQMGGNTEVCVGHLLYVSISYWMSIPLTFLQQYCFFSADRRGRMLIYLSWRFVVKVLHCNASSHKNNARQEREVRLMLTLTVQRSPGALSSVIYSSFSHMQPSMNISHLCLWILRHIILLEGIMSWQC